MRCWKKMVAGGAATLMFAGAAHAGEQPRAVEHADRATTTAAPLGASRNGEGGAPSDPAPARLDPAASGDGSGYVTHDELERFTRELIDRVARERATQTHEPTFTDAG